MKIALLSFHNAYNFGATLQAYALQEAVKELNVDCEYINYINDSRRQEYNMFSQIKREIKNRNFIRVAKLICGIPFMFVRKRNFEFFYEKYLLKTEKIYTSSQEASSLNDSYDKFIVGSDQVWNPENNGKDWAFLLDFVEDDMKKISYSSSFGINNVPEEYVHFYKSNLDSFYRLSTRESVGVEIIKKLCGRNAHLVLDPVFLLTRSKWENIGENRKTGKDKYIFFYTNRNNQIDEFLGTGYNTEKLKFHILSSHVTPKDFLSSKRKVKFSMAPEDFIAEIMNSELVVSASFHCLAMSIILHKQFVAILTGDKGKDERIINLLNISGLRNRVLTSEMDLTKIDEVIDYEIVESRLDIYRDGSKKYLYNAIYDKDDIGFESNKIFDSDCETVTNEMRFCMDNRCTGCGACFAICPFDAIKMKEDEEGFLFPSVDNNKCTNCGKCHDVCQVYKKDDKIFFQQKYYGFKNIDEVRRNSSSGGAFSAIAHYILNQGGVVFGAQMDEDFIVSHKLATSHEEIKKMKQTFYVQSDLGNSYKEAKEWLIKNTPVLFVGTPCQVQGLKLYLGKDYENLFTVDIICHGVPSPLIFRKFIDFLESKGDLTEYKFRDKTHGWRGYNVSAVINGRKYINNGWLKSFNCLFSHNLINRKSCEQCQFANYMRPGDITIGDFWGLDKKDASFVDELGVSLLMINTEKGTKIDGELKKFDIKKYAKADTAQNSLKQTNKANLNRAKLFEIIKLKDYKYVARRYGEYNFYGTIKQVLRNIRG